MKIVPNEATAESTNCLGNTQWCYWIYHDLWMNWPSKWFNDSLIKQWLCLKCVVWIKSRYYIYHIVMWPTSVSYANSLLFSCCMEHKVFFRCTLSSHHHLVLFHLWILWIWMYYSFHILFLTYYFPEWISVLKKTSLSEMCKHKQHDSNSKKF